MEMESLLLQIIKDSSNSKYASVKTTSQEAYDFLEQQQGSRRAYPYEMREKCLSCFQLALESHNTKLISHAVSGMQRILRDDRFHSEMGCTLEDQWLSMQLLRTVTSVCSQPTEIQVEILKVVLNMTCSTWWNTSSNGLLRLLQVCEDVFTEGNSAAVQTAAQAAAGQALRTFCAHLQEEDELQCCNRDVGCDNEKVESVFDEVVPLLNEVCKKLNSRYTQGKSQPGLSFLVQTVLSLLSYLPVSSRKSKLFLDFMWQQLCPALLALLGSPYADKMERIKPFGSVDHVGDQGKNVPLSSADVKTLYHISIELVRLVGSMASLRPMLESVFHRLCVCTHYQHRLEAVRSTRELLSKSARLLDFAGPPVVRDKLSTPPNDLNLIMLTMELLVNGCHSSNSNICYASVDGVVALLMTLRKLCEGDDLNEEYVTVLNDMFKDLASCDYTGPITYSLWEKLCQQDYPVEEIPKSTEIGKSSANTSSECEELNARGGEMRTEVALDAEEYLRNEGNCLDNTDGKIENLSKGFDTDSSGSTEGPEDDEERELQQNMQMAQAASEAEISRRLQIVPKTLLQKDENAANLERVVRQFSSRDEFAQIERQNARHFVQVLEDFLPKLLLIRSSIEADEALQEFASNYCQEITSPRDGKGCLIIINADGVYLATYQVLLLNLKLMHSKYYQSGFVEPPLTEDEFIESIHGSGVLVYLCATWLAELYQLILAKDLLGIAGFKLTAEVPALVNLLMDLDGLGSNNQGSQLLSDCRRLEQALTNQDISPAVDAGRKLSRRLLTATWDAIMEVLSVLLTGCNSLGVTSTVGLLLGTEGAREEHRRAREAIVTCLEGLQIAAQLSNILGLQSRCGAVFSLLAKVCCPSMELAAVTSGHKKLKASMLPGRSKAPRLHTSHVLSMELILGSGLELASHCPDCWTHVFRCCVYVGELEHVCFSKGQHHLALAKIQRKRDTDVSTGQMDDYIFEPPSLPVKLPTPTVDVKDTIRESLSDGILGPENTLIVLCGLSQLVDKLFEEAACKLNLQSLMNFLNELCAASQAQLFANKVTPAKAKVRNGACLTDDGRREGVLLLHGLGDAMLRCVRSGRPLMHVMLAWSVAGPHFMEAACHKDPSVSKKAVACIHDTLMALLGSQPELPHFHFNEALFKPFENLLSLELCDGDVQDEIVSAICEFVEGNRGEIRSGWRPLFGALRAVRAIPPLTLKAPHNGDGNGNSNFMSRGHVRAVLDVFEAFFRTDNALVFANASVDFILCLLKHVQGKDVADTERGESNDGEVRDGAQPTVDLCLASLQCINQCCSILTSMHRMTSCPIFHTASRIQTNAVQQSIDFSPSIPKLHRFGARCTTEDVDDGQIWEETMEPLGCPNTLEELDEPSGILHVWWLILDGLATAATSADHHYQPHITEALFNVLRNTLDVPGPEFAVFAVNRLILPWLQSWLRRSAKVCRGWDNFSSSFKQCCGQTCDLVVDFISRIAETKGLDSVGGVELMLRQLLAMLVECVCEPTESIARLGASCIRHVIVSAGHVLTAPLWEVACWGLCMANDVTLFALRQLTAAFRPNSETSSGDLARVRVAAIRDSSPGDHQRLTQLAIQVFLLDCQDEDCYQGPRRRSDAEEFQDDDRSYIFLLCAPEPEESSSCNGNSQIVKVSLRSVVVGLAVHQIVLQTLGAVLLQGVHHVVPSLANVLLMSPAPTPSSSCIQGPRTETPLTPGMLSRLSEKQLGSLLGALQRSFEAAWDFDDRPGLKFLVQKVCLAGTGSGGTKAFGTANLFRQAGASWTLRTVVLMEMCIHTVLKDEQRFSRHSNQLKESLNEFSKRYAELQAKKSKMEPGPRDAMQHVQEQPLFFLAVQPDLLPLNQVDGQLLQTTPVSDTANVPAHDPQDDDGVQTEEAHEVKVYSVATQNDVDALVEEYKRRKQHHAPPSGAASSWSQRRSVDRSPSTDDDRNDDQEDDDLPLPRISPAVKDVQLQARVWAEAALAAFDLLCQLDDEHIKALLGVVFPFVRSLVAHAGDSTLRQTVAEFLDRVACLHGFSVS